MVELSVIHQWKRIKIVLSANLGFVFIEIFGFSKFLIVSKRLGLGWILEVAERVSKESKFFLREVILIISPLLFHFMVENL